MLEYSKTILKKVSFDRLLFEKELKKSLSYLNKKERTALIDWCKKQFDDALQGIILQFTAMS